MKRQALKIWICIFAVILCIAVIVGMIKRFNILQGDRFNVEEEKGEVIDFESAYQLLNKDLFGRDSVQWLDDALKQEIFLYSEEIKGEFIEVQNEESVFPSELVCALEKMIYQSLDYSLDKITWEEIQESIYFETLNELGANEFKLDLEKMKELFPELKNLEVRDVYEAYEFISGERNCENMFCFQMSNGKKYYVLVVNSGGSAGIVNVMLTQRINDEFVISSEFETQSSGYGSVIQFEDEFYYIFLEYNYNLKNYDGVCIYNLRENAEQNTLKIKYLPYKYVWKNIYNTSEGEELDTYIKGIKENSTLDAYLESGKAADIDVFYGDEEKAENFIIPEDEEQYFSNEYYKIDFANIGIPVYMRKSNLIPSSYRDIWHLRSSFYLQNSKDTSICELNEMEIGDTAPIVGEASLVQMWFKEIEGKVYTCCLYHVSDYNYMLNVSRLEGDKRNRMRTDIISPQRNFVLVEREVYHY